MAAASDLLAEPPACALEDTDAVGDKRTIARGGIFTMGGSAYAGALGFLLTLVVGGMFGAHSAGVFFEAVSIFTILNGIAVLGSDTGLLRVISARRSLHAHEDVRTSIWLSAWPVLVWSALLCVLLWVSSGPISRALLADDAHLLQGYLRVVAITLVFSAFGQAALVASRGFDDLRPYILAYQVGLSTARVALVALVGWLGSDSSHLVAVWALPLVAMDLLVIGYVVRRASVERSSCSTAAPAEDHRALFGEIWRFNVPRGIASFFETCIVWSDVLIVGYFMGPAMAGAYAAASRFITTGTMAMEAMRVGSAPTIAAAYARRQTERANEAYQLSSIWLVLLSWPVFFALATFAPFILGLIGPDFTVAAHAMSIMSIGILGYLLMGNINTVLLMAGRSTITATNSFVTVILNVTLNLLLVPRIGLTGAAIAWSVSLFVDSALCLVRGYRYTGARPPVRGLAVAGAVAGLAFGVSGLVVRAFGAQTFTWFAGYLVASVAAYAVLLRAARTPLRLHDVGQLVGR